jgi:dsRNA-specific ribonuclease
MNNVYKKQIGGNHYQSMTIQPSEFINKNNLPFAEGNAIKYLCRHKQKGQKQDLEKAIHYCQMAIDRDYQKKDFLEEAEKEKKELEESYKESRRQTEERKSKEWLKGYNKWKKNK